MKKTNIVVGLGLALFLGIFISPFASPWLDGLERVAEDHGFLSQAEETPPLLTAPIPDYSFPGVTNERLAVALAGGVGTLVMFGVALAAAFVLRSKNPRETRIPR